MATAYITEYSALPRDFKGLGIMAGQEPALAEQAVAIGAEAKSNAFAAETKFVRIHVDAICSLKFGANPTAVITAKRLAANQTEYFGVNPGDKVSVIANT